MVKLIYRKDERVALAHDITDVPAAEVLARWGDDRALVELPCGEVLTVIVPAHLRERFDVGRRVVLATDGIHVARCEGEPAPATRAPALRRDAHHAGLLTATPAAAHAGR
jgi:hypothetical protein